MHLDKIKKWESPCPPVLLNVGKFRMPCEIQGIPFNWSRPLVIESRPEFNQLAVDLTQNLILQVFLKCSEVKCVIFKETSGNHFDVLENISAQKHTVGIDIFRDIKQRENFIDQLNQIMENRDHLLAINGLKNWHEYLLQKYANDSDKYILLCISDLEQYCTSDRIIHSLRDIALKGAKLGVAIWGIGNTQYNIFTTPNKIVFCRNSQAVYLKVNINQGRHHDEFLNSKDIIYQPLKPKEKTFAYNELLTQLTIAKEDFFLNIQIGSELNDINRPFNFNLGKLLSVNGYEISSTNHALVAGTTGTGKTTLLNRIILSACEKYLPDNIQFFILDYKDGNDFGHLVDSPHCPIVFGDVKQTEIFVKILEFFTEELECRKKFLGGDRPPEYSYYMDEAKKHSDWVQFPRWILVVDEVHAFLSPKLGVDLDIRRRFTHCVNTIATTGRSLGMHLILSTQSFQNLDFQPEVKEQFGLRVSMRLNSSRSCDALFNDNYDAMNLNIFQGIYNDNDFTRFSNQKFQIKPFVANELIARIAEVKKNYSPNVYTTKAISHFFPNEVSESTEKLVGIQQQNASNDRPLWVRGS